MLKRENWSPQKFQFCSIFTFESYKGHDRAFWSKFFFRFKCLQCLSNAFLIVHQKLSVSRQDISKIQLTILCYINKTQVMFLFIL